MKRSTILKAVAVTLLALALLSLVRCTSLFFGDTDDTGLTWLLVSAGFFIAGVLLFAYASVFIKDSIISAKSADGEKDSRTVQKRDYLSNFNEERFAVAGVTFRNNNGTSRQKILERILEEEGICCAIDAKLEEYMYEGEPAIRVNTEYGCVGNIRRSDVKKVQTIIKNNEVFSTVLTPDEFEDEETGKTIYRADIAFLLPKTE